MKCSLLLLFLPLLSYGGITGEQVEKKISKTFAIQTNGYLDIENKYGSIDIAIGEPNQIKMDVTIKAKASSTKKAQETLDRINVSFHEGMNRVEARTEIESSSGWMSWFDSGNVEMEINYQVLVPVDIYLELTNKYGNIYVETTNRDIHIDLSYGDIRLGDINARLSLDMAYSDGALSKIQDGEINLSYADLEMEDGHNVDIDMKYTDLVMGSTSKLKVVSAYCDLKGKDVGEMTYSGKYDDLVLEQVNLIDAESAYSGMVIGGLGKSGNFDMRYGDLKVDKISHGFSRLNMNTSYTGVVLAFEPGTSFSLDAENNYCDIQHGDMKVTEDIQKGGSRSLKASKGTGGGQVVARMNYGELSIDD